MEKKKHRILVVDDDPNFFKLLEGFLAQTTYEVFTSLSGEEGIEQVKNGPSFSIVISDYSMKGMNGIEFLRLVKNHCPNSVRIMVSGALEESVLELMVKKGDIFWFATKPVSRNEFLGGVNRAIKQYELNVGEKLG